MGSWLLDHHSPQVYGGFKKRAKEGEERISAHGIHSHACYLFRQSGSVYPACPFVKP